MATSKKNNFISDDLDWCEEQLATWKAYVNAHPFELLKDRMSFKETKNGGVVQTTVASIEAQGKFLQETMKNYLALLEVVNRLREGDEKKKLEIRGKEDLSPMESGDILNEDTD